MTIPVTLQLPIQTSDGNAWIFRRETELPFLALGIGLAGWGIPRLLGSTVDVCTQIIEIVVLENGQIYVTVSGSAELEYTKEQVLQHLGEGWYLAPTRIRCEEPGEDPGGG